MKILSVSLYNIASIEGPFHIDFECEPLKSEGLFAITGVTGSGKSTILDAICLALYNNTPRLSPIKSHINIADGKNDLSVRDVKTLLRKGAESAFSKVVFKAIDQKIYAVEWKIRRARGYGRIQDEVITLENVTDKTLFPERNKTLVLKEIQRLLGLSFEQFTKSVILAQGEFANFLKATENDRADILEKLTGTEIYSKISSQIFQKNKELQSEIAVFDAQLDAIELLTDEQQQEFQLQLNTLKERESQLAVAQKQWQTQLDWHLKKEQLTQQITQALVHLQVAQQAKNQEQHRFETLHKVEKLQSLKPDWLQKQNIQKQLLVIAKEVNDFSQKITQLGQETTTIQSNIDKAKQHRQRLLQLREKLLPQIQQARVLDVQIAEKTETLRQQAQQIKTLEQNDHALARKIEVQTQALTKIRQSLEQNKLWQNQNAYYERFNDNYALITANCKEAEKAAFEQKKHRNAVGEIKQQMQEATVLIHREKKQNEKLAQEYVSAKKTYERLKEAVKNIDVEKLISEQNRIIQHLELQKSVLNSVQKLQEQGKKLRHIESEKQQKKQELTQIDRKITQVQADVELANHEISVLQKLFQKIQLESSESVEKLRNALMPEMPCPVCGATHHPYHQKKQEDGAVQKLENQLKEAQENHAYLQNRLHDLLSSKKVINAEMLRLNQNQAEEITIKQQEEQKIRLSENKWGLPIDDLDAAETIIKAALSESQKKAESIISKMADFQELKNQENASEIDFRAIVTQTEASDGLLGELQNVFQGLAHRLESAQLLFENAQKTFSEKQQAVNELLGNASWFSLWENTPEKFANHLARAVNDWQQNQENLRTGEQSERSVAQNIVLLLQQQKDQTQQTQNFKMQWQKEQQGVSQLVAERQKLLEAKNADEVESQLQNEWEINQKEVEQKTDDYQKTALALQELIAKKQTQERLLSQLEQEKATYEAKISHWLAENPLFKGVLTSDEFHRWILLDSRWIYQERLQLKQLDDALLTAETLLKDRTEYLELHQSQNVPDISLSEAEKLLSESKQTENNIKQNIGRLHNQWAIHQNAVEKHQNLLQQRQQKQEIAVQWEAINNLIGSSNGKLFQRYAQEFTLDALLRYANVHLANINERYSLERIAHTLSLQVVDKEMGYEVRSVYSLSGGESFLVSLGLALALSSLSSTKMNIETLFIDEGFGSLDTKTLAVSMDALESLQHQGKKVGVISHVQEMTERIAVKIEVKKEGNGKSSISIKSNW